MLVQRISDILINVRFFRAADTERKLIPANKKK